MVKMFCFNYLIDDVLYGGQIPARSWDEAQTLVPFAEIDGELIEEIPYIEEEALFVPQKYRVH